MARKKIGLIGAGNIGGELANQIMQKQLGDAVLVDIPAKEGVAKGKALDIMQNSALYGGDASVIGTSNWEDVAGADVIIVTAGIPRKPGQSRDDLVGVNVGIIRTVADNAKKYCPNAFAIIVANPLDAMVFEFHRRTGFDKSKVAGMAGMLDSARFQYFLADAANVSVKDVRTMVLGGHGDQMVPISSMCTINAVPASQMVPADKMEAIIKRVRGGGGEIVKLMGTSAFYAPATAAIQMAESYLYDQKRLMACAGYLTGEYGYKDMFMGVPMVIGAGGVEKILEVPLTADETTGLKASAEAVMTVVDIVKKTA